MANEATITCTMQILKGNLLYQSLPQTFQADVNGTKGPSPGAITVSTSGTDVDFSELSTPGLCRIMNLDDTNYVEFGIWDPEFGRFYPLGEVLPGETYIIRLSRNLRQEYGTGPGTVGPATNTLRFRAVGGPVVVLVEAFEA